MVVVCFRRFLLLILTLNFASERGNSATVTAVQDKNRHHWDSHRLEAPLPHSEGVVNVIDNVDKVNGDVFFKESPLFSGNLVADVKMQQDNHKLLPLPAIVRKKRWFWRSSKDEDEEEDEKDEKSIEDEEEEEGKEDEKEEDEDSKEKDNEELVFSSGETTTEKPKKTGWRSWFSKAASKVKKTYKKAKESAKKGASKVKEGIKKVGRKIRRGFTKIRRYFSRSDENFATFANKVKERVDEGDEKALVLLNKLGIKVNYDQNGNPIGSSVNENAGNVQEVLKTEGIYFSGNETIHEEAEKGVKNITTSTTLLSVVTEKVDFPFSDKTSSSSISTTSSTIGTHDLELTEPSTTMMLTQSSARTTTSHLITVATAPGTKTTPRTTLTTPKPTTQTTTTPQLATTTTKPRPTTTVQPITTTTTQQPTTTTTTPQPTTTTSTPQPTTTTTTPQSTTTTTTPQSTTTTTTPQPTTTTTTPQPTTTTTTPQPTTTETTPQPTTTPTAPQPTTTTTTPQHTTTTTTPQPTTTTTTPQQTTSTTYPPTTTTTTMRIEVSTEPPPFPDIFGGSNVRDRLHEVFLHGDFSHDELRTTFEFDPALYEDYYYDY